MSSRSHTSADPAGQSSLKAGAQIIVDTLIEQGVDTMFGYTGGVVLPLFDRLYDAPINFIVPRHEQGGCHMADAYARASGKVGVVVATSGPGACNLVTGLATAMMDSVPIVALTGQVRTELIGNDAFQEADTTGITRPVTKHNCIVKDVADLARTIREAFYIASTGRPGPVLIDIPVDVEVAKFRSDGSDKIDLLGYKNRIKGNARQISIAARAINKSERPVLYVGGGVIIANASEELTALAEKAHLPVTMTLLGLGSYDQNRPESLDMLGMHGSAYANYAVQECDLLIAVGARFDDRVTGTVKTFAPNAKIIHIDIDPASISKNVCVDIPVVGDAKFILAELVKEVEFSERKKWFTKIAEWKKKFPFRYDKNSSTIKPQYIVEELCRQTDGRAIITTGVGQNQMWAAQFYRFSRPRQFISSGGLGTMGYGLPAAIGAQIARPKATVVDIDGDHSFNMTMTELSTAVQHKLPVKVCILNNGYMGMVRQWQELFYNKRYSKSYLDNPDYATVARALGAVGITVDKKADVPKTVKLMLDEKQTCVVDFKVEREENVWPMVPAGKSINELVEQLLSWGADFDMVDGHIATTLEGGHTYPRIAHAHGDETGRIIAGALVKKVKQNPNIKIIQNFYAIDLLTNDDNACIGVVGHDRRDTVLIWSANTILATGGAGQLYRETTNPEVATGDGIAMAYRAGAVLSDLEFMQFHPTTLYIAGASRALITETLRGEGAILLDNQGKAFMKDYHQSAELAPRDIVSRAILSQMLKTNSTHVYLDVRQFDKEHFAKRFPLINELCTSFDIDVSRDLIPVRPSAHYMIGGVKTDSSARTSVPNLYACGEIAVTGLHGANRLGSNSLLEGLVFGEITGQSVAHGEKIDITNIRHPSIKYEIPHSDRTRLDTADIRNSLRALMWRNVGITRKARLLTEADEIIRFWQRYVMDKIFDSPSGWECQNMLTVCQLMAGCAEQRTESRGVHFRSDFPDTDDEHFKRHIEIIRGK